MAVSTSDTCEEEPYYGTMTEEIYGSVWQENVIALAIENSEISIPQTQTATLIVRAVFGGNVASTRVDNSNLTFVINEGTATGTQVGASTGVITAGSQEGTATVTATLTDYADVPPAYAEVTVTA